MGNYITKTSEKIKPEGLTKTREVHPGDLILSNSMSFGRPYIMAINGCIHDGWLLLRNDKNLYDLQFLCHLLGSDNMLQQYKSLAAGSTVNNLNKDLVGSTTVSFPPKKEQSKLGAFFNDIDTLITLHQDKIKAIKKYKAGMLQKMFPREGETVPEIRFHGFKEEWEKRKYKDIGTHLSGGTLNYNSLVPDGIYNCVLYGELYTHYDCIIKDIRNKTNSKGNTVQKNDILFPQSTTVDALSLISPACLNVDTAQTSGVFVIRPFSNIDGNFVAYYTKGNQHQRKKLSKKAQGSTIIHLYYQSIKDEIILIPKIEEQRKISQFFQALDNLISFHQREYDKLKELKKGLLQQMFV